MRNLLLFCLLTTLVVAAPLAAQEPETYRIAFWVEDELYFINSDGSGLHHMQYNAQVYDGIVSAQWSPDGRQIALVIVSAENGRAYLYLADGNADNPRPLIDDPVSENAAPQWSPDGSQLIFRDEAGGQVDVFLVDADGRNRRRVIEGYPLRSMPRWSPDGARLAYLTGELGSLNIVLLDLESGTAREVVQAMSNGSLAWSPAGDHIAFQHESSNSDVYTVNLDTGELVQMVVAEFDPNDHDFGWSPNGAQIAVNSSHSGGIDIFTMNPDGSNVQQVTDGNATMYDYSPDGQWIAYWSASEIWIIHPGGSGARQVTSDDENLALATWSPDGDEIVYLSFGDEHRIRIANLERGELRELPGPPGDIRHPVEVSRIP